MADMTDVEQERSTETKPQIDVPHHAMTLVVVCAIGLVGNAIATDNPFFGSLIGMAILYAISLLGVFVTQYIPIRVPSVAWITLIGIVLTLPVVPGSGWIVDRVSNVDFLALATPCLAYAGIAIARREIRVARESGWKLLVVAVVVMIGTYLGSALIAELLL